jgi:hypothetical protein
VSPGRRAILRGLVDGQGAAPACPYPAGSGLALCWSYGAQVTTWRPVAGEGLPWTPAERDALARCWGDLELRELARLLGRSEAAIAAAAAPAEIAA